MKKNNFKEKFQYKFDNLMSKGTIALVGMLFLATAMVIVCAGLVLVILDHGSSSLGENVWASVMHVIDAGTITAAETSNIGFIILMSIVTLCGIFVTSILIGIITTGFEEKLNDLKKGNSKVIEKNHTVILGFDSNVCTLISELVIANENQKDGCIVILSNEDKEVMENVITEEILDFKTTRVICRTGSITDMNILKKCSLESCRSIIINEETDFITVKAILAINNYFKELQIKNPPHIVATINEKSNYDATQIISGGNAEVLLVQDSISRIIAQTCRQPGLSNVLIELFDYDGDELYFESFPELNGVLFGDVLNYFEKAIVFGYKRNGEVYINPAKNELMQKNDELILLVEDDGEAKPAKYNVKNVDNIKAFEKLENKPENILIIGANDMLEQIVLELDNYFYSGSNIIIANENFNDDYVELSTKLKNIKLSIKNCDTNKRDNLNKLTENNITHVLILSDDNVDNETSDAKTLLKLIHLRDIIQKDKKSFSITSEMKDISNQKLAKVTEANDLVVGSNIINLILTQISENRDLARTFQILLSAEGSEIYIRKASHYVKLNTPMNFFEVTEVLKGFDEIAIGYKKQKGNSFEIITNPNKTEKITFTENDYIISLAEE